MLRKLLNTEKEWNCITTPYIKVNTKWIKEVFVTVDCIKYIERNIDQAFHDINLSDKWSLVRENKEK